MFSEILNAVIQMAQTQTDIPISSGALPAMDGITMTITTGRPLETYRNRSDNYRISATLNGKSMCQQFILDELVKLHKRLTRAYNYPSTDQWQVYAIDTEVAPAYIGRQDDGAWLYGSSVEIKFYWRNN